MRGSRPATPRLCVINTCTVTTKPEQEARRLIRNALRDDATVIVTGCYAELDAADIIARCAEENPAWEARLFLLSGAKKESLASLAVHLRAANEDAALHDAVAAWFRAERVAIKAPTMQRSLTLQRSLTVRRARPYLQIQNGCDNACSFCRVHIARGKSVSFPPETILAELRALEAAGFAEAVLTGVNIAQYRARDVPSLDRQGGLNRQGGLSALLAYLLENTVSIALRLSSLDIAYINEDFCRAVAHPRVRPHFHLSVQSLSAFVLAAMRRRYTPTDVFRAVRNLRAAKDDSVEPFISCDLIAGFPGETEALFAETEEAARKIGFSWIHAFPFSPRPGTAAATMKNRVSERDAVRRVAALTEIAREGNAAFRRRQVGKNLAVVIECIEGDEVTVRTENYLTLTLPREKIIAPSLCLRCGQAARVVVYKKDEPYKPDSVTKPPAV